MRGIEVCCCHALLFAAIARSGGDQGEVTFGCSTRLFVLLEVHSRLCRGGLGFRVLLSLGDFLGFDRIGADSGSVGDWVLS